MEIKKTQIIDLREKNTSESHRRWDITLQLWSGSVIKYNPKDNLEETNAGMNTKKEEDIGKWKFFKVLRNWWRRT